ncbi:amidohydrolase family protein [Granulicella sp. WH15]|nr:amidohydrolase family protein [Granulicella sp. WH15]
MLATLVQGKRVFAQESTKPIALVADTVIDGTGKVLHHATIVVEGSTIKSIGGPIPAGSAVYNLGTLTVAPGFIDTHAHIQWHFDNGRLAGKGEPPLQAILHAVDNSVNTINAGFTTIQSPGSAEDLYLRAALARGITPGPRIITSLVPLTEKSGDPEKLRELVRERKAQGADFIKIFASKSIREGGDQTMTDAQLQAACGEAKKLGMRTLIHAHADSAARAASNAGCTSIEHGAFVTDETFRLMAKNGTYFDPNIGLVLQNYIANKEKYMGIGNYNDEGFAFMVKGEEITLEGFKRAIKIPGLKIVYGTDAVAGAHGHNGEEYIARVTKGGQDPMAGMISMTSLSATSLGLGKEIGSIAPGMQADIVAMEGNPLTDPTAVRRVVFVMKGGTIFKNVEPTSHK